ncbi:MAG TPA: DNA helicase II, partial [Gammaproteobacteria bacterium]|nr:DNA helicase II [Gammaproteobacteria bacterium]
LVIAGAGSGKTRVLAHRIAWLLQVERISPFAILAVTFTNKSASEMRGRIENLLEGTAQGMWIGTFHSIAHRLLRSHWREAGLEQNFQILDSEDQQRLVKRVIRELGLDEEKWPARQAQWFINSCKDDGLRPGQVDDRGDRSTITLLEIYRAYEEACARGGLVDFAELLLRVLELLRGDEELLEHYRQRFRHILVDEFQDTNAIQYAWLRLLVGSGSPSRSWLFVVGDDDQSIYGWRGARIENIQQFQRQLPDVKCVRLEQNYRSTGTILAAANAVIACNGTRLGKELWTSHGEGEPIYLYRAFNDLDEASFVVERIARWVEEGGLRSECAILYRSNAQSRVLEDALLRHGVPYRVYGGLRFFERAEIRDALAYLRLVAHRGDDAAFERVVNVPPRGIGARTVERIREQARAGGVTLWQASRELLEQRRLTPRAANALDGFLQLIERLDEETRHLSLARQVDHIRLHSGLVEHFGKERGEKAQARLDNLEELVNAARGYEPDPENGLEPLADFLSHAALEAGEAQGDAWEDCVQLMTLHSAKGLEFPLVFLVGVEEGLFPHRMSAEDPVRLEEERRLCYVGMTRAMRVLYMTFTERRRLHGRDTYPRVSRFIGEIPQELVHEVRMAGTVTPPISLSDSPPPAEEGLRLGQPVRHAVFGPGVVLKLEGEGPQARVQVNFESGGARWLMVSLAGLQPL